MGAVKLARICCRERQPPGSKLQPAHPPFPGAALPSIFKLGHHNPPDGTPKIPGFYHPFCPKAVTALDSHWNLPPNLLRSLQQRGLFPAAAATAPSHRLAPTSPAAGGGGGGGALTVMQGGHE